MTTFEGFKLNVELFKWVQSLRNPILDQFFTHFYLLGKGWILIPLYLFLYLFQKRELLPFTLALIVETFTVQGLKHLLNQPRPGLFFNNFQPLEPVYHYSFPSGDTALAFLIAAYFWNKVNALGKFLLALYAFLIGFGRIYLGAHFPLDVVAGAVIGAASALIVKKIWKKR